MKKIKDFPNFRQFFIYDCGATAMQMVLAYYGFDLRIKKISEIIGTNSKTGTSIKGFKKVAKEFGLKFKSGKMTVKSLKKYIDKNIPVIILIQAWKKEVKNYENCWDSGHCVIPIAYDEDKIYFEDPASISITYLTKDELEKRWHDIDDNKKVKNIGIAFYGKKPMYNPHKAIHMGLDSYKKFKNFLMLDPKKYKTIK